jgi:hypothetical protein
MNHGFGSPPLRDAASVLDLETGRWIAERAEAMRRNDCFDAWTLPVHPPRNSVLMPDSGHPIQVKGWTILVRRFRGSTLVLPA